MTDEHRHHSPTSAGVAESQLLDDVQTLSDHDSSSPVHDGSAGSVHPPHQHSGTHGAHGGRGGGHSGHGDHVGQFRRLFWIMSILAVPVVAFSSGFSMLLGYAVPGGLGAWVAPVLGSVMFFWGGRPFLTGGVSEVRSHRPGMMLLIAMAIAVAWVASLGASVGLLDRALDFWWELALLIVIMLLGHWIEMRSLMQTTSALDSLAALLPDEAEVLNEEAGSRMVAPGDLRVGDVVLVRPGGRVPADGRVVHGAASVDESMITGESRAVRRAEGDRVVAGTIATDSSVRIQVTAVGEDTALAGIARLVSEAQGSSSRAQRIADRASGWLFWFALGVGLITAVVWTVLGAPDEAIVRTITVLVIACPHALGLAIPLVVSIATERAARGGVLVKDRLALESMRTVDTILFDKTGTLTKGEPVVNGIETVDMTEDEVLAVAAAAEAESEHPLAQAIDRAATARRIVVPLGSDFVSSPAVGVTALVQGRRIQVGGPNLLQETGLTELPIAAEWRRQGAIILHVIADGQVIGALQLADAIRDESRAAIDALHALGRQVVMITGDAEAVARTVADELGIDRVFAGVRPEDKAARVQQLQAEGRSVAMVGDGVNDAPALAQADVGIAIGAGTDVAIASAGVILASSDPRSVVSVIELSKASYRKMRQNLWWGAGYNLVSVPLAAGVLAPIGFVLPMSVGAILMSVSTIVVAINAQLLRRLDLHPDRVTPPGTRPVVARKDGGHVGHAH